MRKLTVFNHVTLDGFIADANGDMSWAHRNDPEWNAFVAENASGGGELVFGRITYDLMASYWPTPLALERDPAVAARMNAMAKIVFSRTLNQASWANTRLVKGDPVEAMRNFKNEAGPDLAILGSGSIVSLFSEARLIDAYQIVVNPVALGRGRTMFASVRESFRLTLTSSRAFTNGNVVLCYRPAA